MNPHDIQLAEIIWQYHIIDRPLVKSDIILGLGSYDTRVAQHCAQLWLADWAPWIVFTGAEGNFTRGKWNKSEAEVFADTAVAAGADPSCILIEPRATNTGDNVRLSRRLCQQRALAVDSLILVAKPNMLRRGYATCQQFWPEVEVSCSHPDTHFFHSPAAGHRPADVVSEIVGDLDRIIQYPALGFQAEQHVPGEVRKAFDALVSRGYTSHLLK